VAGLGPLPKNPTQVRRRNGDPLGASAQRLPASGRVGDPMPWPLPVSIGATQQHARELEVWTRLWATPQAVAWERLGWTDVVARYARLIVQAEVYGAKPAFLAEVRQLEDRLGLNPLAMARLRWTIVESDEPRGELVALPSIDERMRVLAD
jgi:hypothetical protein